MKFYIAQNIDREKANLLEKHLKDFNNLIFPRTDIKVSNLVLGGFLLEPESAEGYNLLDSCKDVKINLKDNSVEFNYEGYRYKLLLNKS